MIVSVSRACNVCVCTRHIPGGGWEPNVPKRIVIPDTFDLVGTSDWSPQGKLVGGPYKDSVWTRTRARP